MPTIKHWILRRRDHSPAPPVAHQLNGLYLPSIGLAISSPYAPIRTEKGYDGVALVLEALNALVCFHSNFSVHVFWLKKRNTKNTFCSYPMLIKIQFSHT